MKAMTLGSFKDTVKGPALAAGLGAAALGAFSMAAHAGGAQCAPMERASSGHVFDAGTSAHIYSRQSIGAVGISIFPGADLGNQSPHKLGNILRSTMQKYGVPAECYVHKTSSQNGTSIQFHIAGLAWKEDGSLNISQSLDKTPCAG